MHMKINHELTTTTFTIEGYKITKQHGVVKGIIVRSRSIIGNIGAGIQSLFGGNITLLTELCEQARKDAYETMIKQAEAQGANAVIGIRYDATDVMQGITEVLCYGTAVTVKKA